MKHRIALIGLGMAAAPHAKGLLELRDRVEVAWAASRSQARCDAFAARFPFPTTTDIDRVIEDPSVTAVAVITPPNSHLELVRRCAAAGKHVLLEKPVEITLARAERTVAAACEAGVTLAVVLQSRFRESSRILGERIRCGAIGDIAAASVTVPWWRPQTYYDEPGRGTRARDGGGVLMTQAIHALDLFQSLVGGVRAVAAVAATTVLHDMECEDFVAAGLVLANGAPGNLMTSTANYPGAVETIEILGTRATAILAADVLDVRFRDGRSERFGKAATVGAHGADPMAFSHQAHRAVMADFLAALEDGGEPLVGGGEALKVQRLIDALLRSAETGARATVADRRAPAG